MEAVAIQQPAVPAPMRVQPYRPALGCLPFIDAEVQDDGGIHVKVAGCLPCARLAAVVDSETTSSNCHLFCCWDHNARQRLLASFFHAANRVTGWRQWWWPVP